MNRTQRLGGLALLAAISALVSGCAPEVLSPPAETVSAVPAEHRIVVPAPPEDPIPEIVWPLTGLGAVGVDQANLDRVAIGVKIENGYYARPQTGLEYADIVFEEYINNSATRFLAVFHTYYPEEVGPVRSARNMDPNIIGSFDTALVASGCNFAVQYVFQNVHQYLFMEDAKYSGVTKGYIWYSEGFFRVSPTISMHSLRVDLGPLAESAVEKGASPASQQFYYAYPADTATATIEGTPVGTIDIRFSGNARPHWNWDAESRLWKRFEFDDPHLTKDGNQISAANIVILKVRVAYTNGVNPESFVIRTNDPGFVASGGKVIPILWSKADRTDTFHLTTLEGEPVHLAPGTTWVEMVPRSGSGEWTYIKFDGVQQQ
ncbi:MAG: DUF3048 domain-containing protein [Demequinaceae bacterium]|nr:DUF3048 domain-containing protein [Demequinaceae bacterium]